ncbi:MAG: zinc ribbon domain-containing protein [Planctomycetes bacterium]|nr:zinc ribbon domain-containing protein [Planctomycetota bacterium]
MPIYEYRCLNCRHEFGQLVRSEAEERSLACPECGKKALEKKLSVFAARDGATSRPSLPPSCAGCQNPGGSCPMRQ